MKTSIYILAPRFCLLFLFFGFLSFGQTAPPNYAVSMYLNSGGSGTIATNLSVVYDASAGAPQTFIGTEKILIYEYSEEYDDLDVVVLMVNMYGVEYLDGGSLIRAEGSVNHYPIDIIKVGYQGIRNPNVYNGLQYSGSNSVATNNSQVEIEIPAGNYTRNPINSITPMYHSNSFDQNSGYLISGSYNGNPVGSTYKRGNQTSFPLPFVGPPIQANEYFPAGILSLSSFGGVGYTANNSAPGRTYVIGFYALPNSTSYGIRYHEIVWKVTGSACNLNVVAKDTSAILNNGQVLLNPGMFDNGSDTSCGLLNSYVSPSSLNCTNVGMNTVYLVMEDLNGNIDSASAQIEIIDQSLSGALTATPTSSVFTGGNPNKIFIGYGAQSVLLDANPSGGTNYAYQWTGPNLSCTSCAQPEFTPNTDGLYTIYLSLSSPSSCSAYSDSITIEVEDIQADSKGKKVFLCHVKIRNNKPPKLKTKKVKISKVGQHIGPHSDDYLGRCEGDDDDNDGDDDRKGSHDFFTDGEVNPILIYPNPSQNGFTLRLDYEERQDMVLTIYDLTGKVVFIKSLNGLEGQTEFFLGENLAQGFYLIELVSDQSREVRKIQIL